MNKKFFLLIMMLSVYSSVLYSINTPWLHTEGKYIKDPSGNNVILRGFSFVSLYVTGERIGPRTSYYPYTNEPDEAKANIKAMIDLATDDAQGWYCRVLRLPVYPVSVDADPGWNNTASRARYNELIQCAIDHAVSRGIYVILDWHYVDDYGDKLASTQAFWDWAAPKFKNYSNVLYEIYNEPIGYAYLGSTTPRDVSWTTWKKTIAQPIVDRIRKTHGANNLILVGSPQWCQLLGGANSDPINSTNIAYVSHIYPYHYDVANPVGDLSAYLGETINNYPVFFSEWGFQDGAAIPCDSVDEDRYAVGMKAKLKAYGTSWTAWCFDPWWQPIIWGNWQFTDLLGNSLPNTGGYMGKFMKDFLYEERNNNLPSGSTTTPTPTPVVTSASLKGDVNNSGTIDIIDALLVAQYTVGLSVPNFNPSAADVNNDGIIDIIDALKIAQYTVGLISL